MLSDKDLDTIFRTARSQNKWQDKPVSEVTLRAVYDLMRWGPTSANCSPARIVFVSSGKERDKLVGCVSAGNAEKVRTAPVTALVGYDTEFYDLIPELFPHSPAARDWFANDEKLAHETAFRNSSLQGAYFIIAARALGLDCGPMSGFNADAVNETFFPDGRVKVNFICSIGYGDPEGVFPRSPRLEFGRACSII